MQLSECVYCVAITFKMTEQAEQWICTTFCVKLEHSSHRNYSNGTEGFGGWCNECSTNKSRESAQSDPHSGRPATSRTPETVERVHAPTNKDQRLTVWGLVADLGNSKTTASKILMQDLGMKCCGKIRSVASATRAERMGQLMAIQTKDFSEHFEQWKGH